ncbi:hypothetical protein J132_09265 [Termitomyces sp. J132]|nr:hypothetical protein J132_09265 [Termitomyces sp. J132]
MFRFVVLAGLLLVGVHGIGQDTCVVFQPSSSTISIATQGAAAPILLSADDWPGVQLAAADFATDIQKVTGVLPTLSNVTASNATTAISSKKSKAISTPIIVGTLGKSSLIAQIVNATNLDVSSIQGHWEAFMSLEVENPLPGIGNAYVIIGADKRGTIFALYDHSEQIGVSPWYWWADVPVTTHSGLFVESTGCSHGSPSVKYRGIFLNDEQPALQNWATEKFTNGTAADLGPFGAPFNHFFYAKLISSVNAVDCRFELILRLKANYLWPAMWAGMFGIDDPQNQFFADYFGVVMGTSHQEPMMRSTPNEFSYEGKGPWDYETNANNINAYWRVGIERAKPYESIISIGMRGFGDMPLSETENIALLQNIVNTQQGIISSVMNEDSASVPQLWCLYQEVEGYYDDGLQVPDYVTLLWTDDNWGNVRRYPTQSERNRTGGAGIYYHVLIYEQMSLAVEREANRIWILNVGDMKPYEREIEFFLNLGWDATRWNPDNLDSFISSWAQREFQVSSSDAATVTDIVGNLTRFNSRRKPELLNSTTFSLISYREAERVLDAWATLKDASINIYNSLSADFKPAFFQLVHHPVIASANLANMLIAAGQNNVRASQARLSANGLADNVETYFEEDYNIEHQYHTMLDGKWEHIMDQTHVGYFYWQQPMANTMPPITRVSSRKQVLAGVMRISPEGTLGAWPGDNPNQCGQGYNCPPPTVTLDNFDTFGTRYIDVGSGGPSSFTFTVTTNATWVKLSQTRGSVSPSAPETRVFASVNDWSQLPDGTSSATLTFTTTALNPFSQLPLSVPVNFNVTKHTLPSTFKGFVEGAGVISIEAAHTSRNTSVSGVSWKVLPRYGRTLSAITPWPHLGNNEANYTAGAGPSVEYDFYNFNTIGGSGNLTITTFVNPSFNAGEKDRPLGFAVQLDSQAPQALYFFPPAPPGGFPAAWGGNDGFAANNIISAVAQVTGVTPGPHTLKIAMIEPAVVVEKIVINTGVLMPSYLGPPESLIV